MLLTFTIDNVNIYRHKRENIDICNMINMLFLRISIIALIYCNANYKSDHFELMTEFEQIVLNLIMLIYFTTSWISRIFWIRFDIVINLATSRFCGQDRNQRRGNHAIVFVSPSSMLVRDGFWVFLCFSEFFWVFLGLSGLVWVLLSFVKLNLLKSGKPTKLFRYYAYSYWIKLTWVSK